MESRQAGDFFFCWFCVFSKKTVSCIFAKCSEVLSTQVSYHRKKGTILFFVCFLFKDLLINKAVEKGHCYLTKWL